MTEMKKRHGIFGAAGAVALGLALLFWSAGCGGPQQGGGTADEHDHAAHEHAAHGHAESAGSAAGALKTALPDGNPHKGYCPVMGDPVDYAKASADPLLHTDYQGKRYHFCCKGCKKKFERDPERWIAHPVPPKKEEGEG